VGLSNNTNYELTQDLMNHLIITQPKERRRSWIGWTG